MCILCMRVDLCPRAAEKVWDSVGRAGFADRAVKTLSVRPLPDGCDRRISCGVVFKYGRICMPSATGKEKGKIIFTRNRTIFTNFVFLKKPFDNRR